jgi:hypothetical protein
VVHPVDQVVLHRVGGRVDQLDPGYRPRFECSETNLGRAGPGRAGPTRPGFEPQLRYLEDKLGRVLALDDTRDGIAASLGKRAPVWMGT